MQARESGDGSAGINGRVRDRLVRYPSKPRLELSAGMPAHQGLRKIHLSLLRAILHNGEGVIGSRDPEFLHDFRVAVRRARSALTQVKGVFPATEAERARVALSSMTRVTGEARDLDVFLEKLEAYESGLPQQIRQELIPVKELARRRRRGQQPVLSEALGAASWAAAVDRWETFLLSGTDPQSLPKKGRRPLGVVAAKRIRKAYRRVAGRESLTGLEIEVLHRLRIDCKKLRYLLEFFRSLYPGREAASLLKRLKSLQGVLGDLHDLAVHREMARSIWTEIRPRPGSSIPLDLLERRLGKLHARAHEATEGKFQRFRAHATPW